MTHRDGLSRFSIGSGTTRALIALLVAVTLALLVSAPASAEKAVVLRALDKITARITTFEATIGQPAEFGTLVIFARTCTKRPPEEPPETSAFLEISERRPGERASTDLFVGWMFASSPALSALEHPVYDVWVIDCKTSAADSEAPPSEKSAEKASAASRR